MNRPLALSDEEDDCFLNGKPALIRHLYTGASPQQAVAPLLKRIAIDAPVRARYISKRWRSHCRSWTRLIC
jgi:hypothetical protein